MLDNLVREEIRKKGISVRQAAREMGISHTTAIRIINGKNSDLDTLKKVCDWLNVEINSVLHEEFTDNSGLNSKLILFLEQNPNLSQSLEEALECFENRSIPKEVITDMTSYITFRLQQEISRSA